jgi:hypothetical protein
VSNLHKLRIKSRTNNYYNQTKALVSAKVFLYVLIKMKIPVRFGKFNLIIKESILKLMPFNQKNNQIIKLRR